MLVDKIWAKMDGYGPLLAQNYKKNMYLTTAPSLLLLCATNRFQRMSVLKQPSVTFASFSFFTKISKLGFWQAFNNFSIVLAKDRFPTPHCVCSTLCHCCKKYCFSKRPLCRLLATLPTLFATFWLANLPSEGHRLATLEVCSGTTLQQFC